MSLVNANREVEMDTVDIHQAKSPFSRLLARAAKGETVIIAQAGQPLAKLMPMETPSSSQVHRLGFLKGAFQIPEDFDSMGSEQITGMFGDDQRS